MKRAWLPALLFLTALSPGATQDRAPRLPVTERGVEDALYRDITDYRASMGLPAVPRSRLLDRVARTHVVDLETWHADQARDARGLACNARSWSDHGDWSPVCYTPDHAHAADMWNKPAQITHGGYSGYGFEIAFEDPGAAVDAEEALEVWKHSRAHNAVIIEQDIWRDAHWQAMGVAVYGGHAVVWFGKEPDRDRE